MKNCLVKQERPCEQLVDKKDFNIIAGGWTIEDSKLGGGVRAFHANSTYRDVKTLACQAEAVSVIDAICRDWLADEVKIKVGLSIAFLAFPEFKIALRTPILTFNALFYDFAELRIKAIAF